MESSECFKCGQDIRSRQQKLQCSSCSVSLHRTCSRMTQAMYREHAKGTLVAMMKCDFCDVNGKIQIRANIGRDKRTAYTAGNDGNSAISPPSERERISSSIGNSISTSARMESLLNPVQSTPLVSSGTQSDTSPSVVQCETYTPGQNILPNVTEVQNRVLTSTTVPSTSTSNRVQSTTPSSITGLSTSSTSNRVQSTITTSTTGQSTSTSYRVQSTTPSSTTGPSTSTSNRVQSTTPSSTTRPSTSSTSNRVQSTITTSTTGPSTSTSNRVQSTLSSSTSGPSTSSTSNRVQSTITTSTTGPSTSTSNRVQSTTPSSTTGPSTSSTSNRVQSTITTSTTGPSTSTSNRVLSTLSSSTTGPSASSTSNRVQSTITTSTTGPSTSTSNRVLSTLSSSTTGPSASSTSNRVQSTITTFMTGQRMTSSLTGSQNGASTSSDVNDTPQQNALGEKVKDLYTSYILQKDGLVWFYIKPDVMEQLKESKQSKKNDLSLKLRVGYITDSGSVKEGLPNDMLMMTINYHTLPVPKDSNLKAKTSNFDITDLCSEKNRLNCSTTKNTLHVRVELFRKKNIDALLDAVSVFPAQFSKDIIMSKFNHDDDCEIATTNIKASLTCPIGKMRLMRPCRSKHCTHIQCVDAKTILSMNQNKSVWKCPVCQQPAAYQDLYIDSLFTDILDTVPWNVVEVEFLEDGSWTHTSSDKKKETTDKDKENICVLLDETIDKLDVIDLTETDDERTPVKKKPLDTVKKKPLMTNTNLLNKGYATVRNLIDGVASKLDKVKEIQAPTGCHRNKRNHYRPKGPYNRHKRFDNNGSVRNGYTNYGQNQSNYNRWSNWRNTDTDVWRGYNSTHRDTNTSSWRSGYSGYNTQNNNTNNIFSLVFRPFQR